MRRKSFLIAFICSLFLVACEQTDQTDNRGEPRGGLVFRLRTAGYESEEGRSVSVEKADYDRVEYYVTDEDGYVVDGIKSFYDPSAAELRLEGLREGEYHLLVLGIDGDWEWDRAVVRELRHQSDEWLAFPADLHRPLEAEYFYSLNPFRVTSATGPDGKEEGVTFSGDVVQRRIVGRADFSFSFNNEYVRHAVTGLKVRLDNVRFRTGFSGDGMFSGQSDGITDELDVSLSAGKLFLPTVDDSPLAGEVEVLTRNCQGHQVRRVFAFGGLSVSGNRIERIHTRVEHPDDRTGTMFFTEAAYREGAYGRILQDGETKDVYADSRSRSFNTARPLQAEVTGEGQLHLRFYSPRELKNVTVRARIPSVDPEYFDLAYFESLPAFADFYRELPLLTGDGVYRTESGRNLHLAALEPAILQGMELKVDADDDYWRKLQQIKHGWNISFGLYGGDPDKTDGGPTGNWMGIRPVHCREVVALFINFTYMIDMPEHEEILRANEDRLYGNGGVTDKVTAETVLAQMRQERSLTVGLVYPGNGVVGLGGGSVFGAYQSAWLRHYYDTYACEVMFHELGHVMGYSHSSSFTYGPWAQELMNKFYVEHIHEMPVDSPDYLDSKNNPNLY
ncbi:MAG TPA: hypothetical protein H9752_01595 [Candidatus Phocaeicola excrementigallinarum]|nr:hypothetical protein [Candidatus Phocaeicola excrementigallinarum]